MLLIDKNIDLILDVLLKRFVLDVVGDDNIEFIDVFVFKYFELEGLKKLRIIVVADVVIKFEHNSAIKAKIVII